MITHASRPRVIYIVAMETIRNCGVEHAHRQISVNCRVKRKIRQRIMKKQHRSVFHSMRVRRSWNATWYFQSNHPHGRIRAFKRWSCGTCFSKGVSTERFVVLRKIGLQNGCLLEPGPEQIRFSTSFSCGGWRKCQMERKLRKRAPTRPEGRKRKRKKPKMEPGGKRMPKGSERESK